MLWVEICESVHECVSHFMGLREARVTRVPLLTPTHQLVLELGTMRGIELGAVIATGMLHMAFQGGGTKGLFIALASVGWLSYIGWQVWHNPGLWRQWGVRTHNLKASFLLPTIVFVLAKVSMLLFVLSFAHDLWNEHIFFLLVLYLLWGVFQQFLVQTLGALTLENSFLKLG